MLVINSRRVLYFWLGLGVLTCPPLTEGSPVAEAPADHPNESAGPPPTTSYESVRDFGTQSIFYRASAPVGELYLELPGGNPIPWCTGVVISANLVLTAAHCLTGKEGVALPYTGLIFTLGLSRRDGEEPFTLEIVPVDSGVRKDGPSIDFVVLKSKRPFDVSSLHLPVGGPVPDGRQTLYIYHRPFGGDLVLTRLECRAMPEPVEGPWLHHRCDTDHGSSGGLILDENMAMVGIHLAGGKTSSPETYNVGLLLSSIIQKSEVVRAAFNSAPEPGDTTVAEVPTEAPTLQLKTSSGDAFVLVRDNWYLIAGGATKPSRQKLTIQSPTDGDSYVLWDSQHDVIYELQKKKDGRARVRKPEEMQWTDIGQITTQRK